MGKRGSGQFGQKGEGKRCKIRKKTQIKVLGAQQKKGNLKKQKNAERGEKQKRHVK